MLRVGSVPACCVSRNECVLLSVGFNLSVLGGSRKAAPVVSSLDYPGSFLSTQVKSGHLFLFITRRLVARVRWIDPVQIKFMSRCILPKRDASSQNIGKGERLSELSNFGV